MSSDLPPSYDEVMSNDTAPATPQTDVGSSMSPPSLLLRPNPPVSDHSNLRAGAEGQLESRFNLQGQHQTKITIVLDK